MPNKRFPIPGYPDLYLFVEVEHGECEDDDFEEVAIYYKGDETEIALLNGAVLNFLANGQLINARTALDKICLRAADWGHLDQRSAIINSNNVAFQPCEYDSYTTVFAVPFSLFKEAYLFYSSGPVEHIIDMSKYPHTCPKCKQKCYIGFQVVEHLPGKNCIPEVVDNDEIPF